MAKLEVPVAWRGTKRVDDPKAHELLDGVVGTYVIYDPSFRFKYPDGCNRIVYIGRGNIGDRIYRHSLKKRTKRTPNPGNPLVRKLIHEKQRKLRFHYTILPSAVARCYEYDLLAEFVLWYGRRPWGNRSGGSWPLTQQIRWDEDTNIIGLYDVKCR